MMAEGLIEPSHFYGTINCNGVNAQATFAASRRRADWR